MRLAAVARALRWAAGGIALAASLAVCAGDQQYEPLAASVRASLHSAVSDLASPEPIFANSVERQRWLSAMVERLSKRFPNEDEARDFLKTVHYEASRAGLDPQLVLSLIEVESGFRKYAVSSAKARGFMQVMPFWVDLIGRPGDNLFHLRTNLRYGCTILRHYIDIEKGDLFGALGRYNGSLGKSRYPDLVRNAWQRRWSWTPATVAAQDEPASRLAE